MRPSIPDYVSFARSIAIWSKTCTSIGSPELRGRGGEESDGEQYLDRPGSNICTFSRARRRRPGN